MILSNDPKYRYLVIMHASDGYYSDNVYKQAVTLEDVKIHVRNFYNKIAGESKGKKVESILLFDCVFKGTVELGIDIKLVENSNVVNQ